MMVVDLLTLVIAGGGAGWLAYRVIEVWAWAQSLNPRDKRRLALALAFALGVAAKAILIVFTTTYPTAWQAWVEVLVAAGMTAAGLAQLVHGEKRLAV